jgi:hypothetical protein
MNEVIEQPNIETMIYEIRGKQVMLDSDLAKLYQCKNGTKSINLAVNRNKNKFPDDFYFQITKEEFYRILRFQNETLELKQGKYSKYLPYVFTEEGIAMLASVLNTNIADEVSVKIMRAFVIMRRYITTDLSKNNNILINHENRILKLEESFEKLEEKQEINHIFFDGQIYDAYSLLIDILSKAKSEIIIIDNYAGKELLDITKNIKVRIIIVSSNINDILKKKYEEQYRNVEFINNNLFHDRFIIIDKVTLYHCGSSFKDLGKKCFAINKIEDKQYLNLLLEYLK